MASEELRKRLEALNRAPLRNPPPDTTPQEAPPARPARPSRRAASDAASVPAATAKRASGSLEEWLPGEPLDHPTGRRCYVVSPDLGSLPVSATPVLDRAREAMSGDAIRSRLTREGASEPARAVFLDIETLGLTISEPLSLVGLLLLAPDGAAACRQFMARDLDEEAGTLAAFSDEVASAELLVSFNGISFDLAILCARATVHGVAMPRMPLHLDMLLEARRRYGRRLPNCRLTTLEQHVCGRTRDDDVPGHLVPGVYREFLRTGNAAGLARIAEHNILDLLTTADLFGRFYGG